MAYVNETKTQKMNSSYRLAVVVMFVSMTDILGCHYYEMFVNNVAIYLDSMNFPYVLHKKW